MGMVRRMLGNLVEGQLRGKEWREDENRVGFLCFEMKL